MHFDTTLNLVWLLLGLGALAGTVSSAFQRGSPWDRKRSWLHVIGVGLIVAALFPYISATDDVVRVSHFDSQHRSDGRHSENQKSDSLIRLYEAMDTPLVQPVSSLTVVRYFSPLAKTISPKLLDRETPRRPGRSPPQTKSEGEQDSLVLLRTLAA